VWGWKGFFCLYVGGGGGGGKGVIWHGTGMALFWNTSSNLAGTNE